MLIVLTRSVSAGVRPAVGQRLPAWALFIFRLAPLWLFVGIVATWSQDPLAPPGLNGDYQYFATMGRRVLAGDFTVYSDPTNQAGPFTLVLAALTGWHPVVATAACAAAVTATLLRVTCLLARASHMDRAAWWVTMSWSSVVAVIPMIIWGDGNQLRSWGHFEYLVVPLLWTACGALATDGTNVPQPAEQGQPGGWGHRQRDLLAGTLMGVSIGLSPWGVLGLPVLLLNRRLGYLTAVMTRALAAAIATVVIYVPFISTGEFHLLRMRWTILGKGTLLDFVGGPQVTAVPWSYRVLQAVIVLIAGTASVWWVRSRPDLCWLPVVSILVMRMVTEIVLWPYYWLALYTLVVPALTIAAVRRHLLEAAGWAALLFLCGIKLFAGTGQLLQLLPLALVVGALHVVVCRVPRASLRVLSSVDR